MGEPLRVGTADARRRFKEILELAEAGETVEITRRDDVVAIVGPPPNAAPKKSFAEWYAQWRHEYDVDNWPDDDPWADVRDPSPGRPSPW